tara:strand:- start:7668 stop:7925 length:258 start_codon:yes stop_codon:yes gene_type:complete
MRIVVIIDVNEDKLIEKVDSSQKGLNLGDCISEALETLEDFGVNPVEVIEPDHDIYCYLNESGGINKAITDQKVGCHVVKLIKGE